MKAKYIITKDSGSSLELAIVFSPIYNHSDFKKMGDTILSAGQCFITKDWENPDNDEPLVQCFGDSMTLKLKSRGEVDAKIIARNFREGI